MDQYKELQSRLYDLEFKVYGSKVDKKVFKQVDELLSDIIDALDGDYEVFEPGEPGLYECGSTTQGMALTGRNPENIMADDEDELDDITFEARLELEWCRDILDDSWQSGLMFTWEVDNGDDS